MELPADRPRESGESTPFPDLMNDPAYATNVEGNGKGAEEPDTCRICRGEGSDEEQLFYPCKCSGSIKFVHQACLVEWLSHSQKKYCELCKTPFRFTKLYDPNMPHELPAPLFVRQVLVHGFRTIVTWLRFGLVAFVWLVWLPWSMRAIWRALFWLADGRWPTGDVSGRAGAQDTLTNLMPNGSVIGVVSTALTSSTAAQPQATDTTSVPSPGPSMFSFSTGEPLMLTLIKKALSALFFPGLSSPAGSMTSDSSDSTTGSYKQRHPSWLSDVKFLNSLTPSPTFNNILIDTLEGQLITLLVVISFILVFLIREWVVQQQPMANIGDGEREAAVQLIANDGQNQPVEAPEPEPQHVFQVEVPNEETEDQTENTPDRDDGEHSETHFGASNETMDFEDTQPESSDFPSIFQGANLHDFGSGHHFSPQEFAQHGHTWPGADLFMDIWARANEDPEEVLRIIREEGREEDLRWIAAAMRTLQQNGYSPPSARNGELGQATSNSLGRVHSNDAAAAWFDEAGLMSEDARGSSARSPPNEGSWGSSSLPNSGIGDSINLGIPQQDFAFNFPGSAPNTVNPFESQPAQQASAISIPDETNTNPASIPSANDALDDNVEPSMSASQASPTDHSTAEPPKNLTDRVFDWFWGDITPAELPEERPQHDEEHIVEDPALEAPFVPAQNNRQLGEDGIEEDEAGAPEAADAGFNANDIDAIEDGDDLEGILELIGMQGPIFGLLQNGVFSALLISFTVAVGIWLPYLWGKIALVLLDNPVQLIFGVPMTTVSIVADVTLDTLIGSLGYVMYWASLVCKVFLSPLSNLVPMGSWIPQTKSVTSASLSLIDASSRRLKHVAGALFVFHESDVPVFSVLSHQALKMHEARIAGLFRTVYAVGKFIVHDLPLRVISLRSGSAFPFDYEVSSLSNSLDEAWGQTYSSVSNLLGLMTNGKWAIAGAPQAAPTHITVDADLAMWTTKDRVIAITMGYLLVSLLGLLYLRITGLISGVNRGQRIEGLLAEVLHQAGGVMKVIVIIGIEMIVFPLYCGALLDVALLPLFDKATVASRVDFTSSSPLTSLFVHWFIGTCYMFHFALFVSMCRKIMRNGVLCRLPTFGLTYDRLTRQQISSVTLMTRLSTLSVMFWSETSIRNCAKLPSALWSMER